MKKLIHVGTSISSTFGVLDGDDVTSKQPVTLTLEKLDEASFKAALEQLLKVRNQDNQEQVDE